MMSWEIERQRPPYCLAWRTHLGTQPFDYEAMQLGGRKPLVDHTAANESKSFLASKQIKVLSSSSAIRRVHPVAF